MTLLPYHIFHVLLLRSCVLPVVLDSLLDRREVQDTARGVSQPQMWAALLQILPGDGDRKRHEQTGCINTCAGLSF